MGHRNFTVCLTQEEAKEIAALLSVFGGTVGGFCTSIVRDYINLTPDQIRVVRQQIRELAQAQHKLPSGHVIIRGA